MEHTHLCRTSLPCFLHPTSEPVLLHTFIQYMTFWKKTHKAYGIQSPRQKRVVDTSHRPFTLFTFLPELMI